MKQYIMTTTPPRLLWIGIGNMGRGMVKNLATKGTSTFTSPLLLYNRTLTRATALSATLPPGTTTATTDLLSAITTSDVIITCLSHDAAVSSIIQLALTTDLTGKLFIDCSTIHPDTTTSLAASLSDKSASFVACPVFGAPTMADAGKLIAVLAGPAPAVNRARPFFKDVTARAEIDLSGRTYGDATTLKIIGNTFVFNMVEQLAEGLTLAEKSGLGTEPLREFVGHMFPGPYAAYAERMLDGDYHERTEPLFAVDLARKDLRHAMDLAEKAGVNITNAETADKHLIKVKEHAGEIGDIAAIYGAVRSESGLKYENK